MKYKWFEPIAILKVNKNTWNRIKNKYKVKTLKELFKILLEGDQMDNEIIKNAGFESLGEFYELISNVDISTMQKMKTFNFWKKNDGTKIGLLKLINNEYDGYICIQIYLTSKKINHVGQHMAYFFSLCIFN